MKKVVTHTVMLIAAIAVFFTGAGVTIVNYCCSGCAEQTLLVSEVHACCMEVHHSDTENGHCSIHNVLCSTTEQGLSVNQDDGHCSASRLSIDLDASMFRPNVAPSFVWLSGSPVSLISILPKEIGYEGYVLSINSPPKLDPRSYLSLISVLII